MPISLLADEPAVKSLRQVVVEGALAEAELFRAWCPEPVSVSVMESGHGDLFTRNLGGVILAEVEGLVLLTPDPFPVVVPFPRLGEVERRACRIRDRIRGALSRIRS